eukprot:COSAG02_NODE_3357_length_6878_cov_3.553326_2_plen_231_part_00
MLLARHTGRNRVQDVPKRHHDQRAGESADIRRGDEEAAARGHHESTRAAAEAGRTDQNQPGQGPTAAAATAAEAGRRKGRRVEKEVIEEEEEVAVNAQLSLLPRFCVRVAQATDRRTTRLHHRHTSFLLVTHAGHTPRLLPLCPILVRSLCLSISLSLCLSVSLSPCLSVSLSLCLCLSPCLSVSLSLSSALEHCSATVRRLLLVSTVESHGLIALHPQLRGLVVLESIR